ncbi:MAG TPA: urease accessory protein UreD [Methylomirabilota bacterium]|nr:urease accessory protein UreD [Methylomirabilota bacterium]
MALRFARDASGRTFLARKFTTYPFFCAAPFHLDRVPRGMLTAILQSSSGGLYEGDRLALSIDVEEGAEAHVATQGATVAHAMPHGDEARHEVRIHAAAGSFVEYLPDPLILLPTASVRSRVEVVAEVGSTVIIGDAFLTHDPAGQGRRFRRLAGELALRRPGATPFAIERFDVTGDAVESAWRRLVPRPCTAQGSLWVSAPVSADELAATLNLALDHVPGLYAGACILPSGRGAMARLLAADAVALGNGFRAAWRATRCALAGVAPPSRLQSGWL